MPTTPPPAALPFAILAAATLLAAPALGWTPASQRQIAEEAARLAPPDFYRQIARHKDAFFQGATDPLRDQRPEDHFANGNGDGRLEEAIAQAVENVITAIRIHRPFEEIAYRAGVVSHYLADANNPLNCAEDDPEEPRYFADFARYLEHAEPRIGLVFYGFRPDFAASGGLPRLLSETLGRSRQLYPMVGREYRRVGFQSGVRSFDDRSTAYAVASLAYSHAVSDIAEVLRYIWIAAGGIDSRPHVPQRGVHVLHVPKVSAR